MRHMRAWRLPRRKLGIKLSAKPLSEEKSRRSVARLASRPHIASTQTKETSHCSIPRSRHPNSSQMDSVLKLLALAISCLPCKWVFCVYMHSSIPYNSMLIFRRPLKLLGSGQESTTAPPVAINDDTVEHDSDEESKQPAGMVLPSTKSN